MPLADLARRTLRRARPPGQRRASVVGPLGKLRMGADLARAATLGTRRPIFVGWQLTDRCNLSCDYCGRWDLGRPELPHARILPLVEELATAGVRRLALTGGEPLVHPMCLPLARRARARGIQVSLNTNGALLPRHIDALRTAVDTITISVDGDRDRHDARRGQGSHAAAVEGARAAVAAGLPVHLHCVVSREERPGQALHAVDAVLELAGGLGGSAGFAPVEDVPGMGRRDTEALKPAVQAWQAVVDHLLARKAAGDRRVQNSESGLRYLRRWPVYAPIQCSAGVVYARIEPDGRLYGCGNLVLGEGPSVADQPFATAFSALGGQGCQACWCDTRVEMNLVLSGDPSALAAAFWR